MNNLEKISFVYDGTLTSSDGLKKFNSERNNSNDIYIISAREKKDGILEFANNNDIKKENVFATGSNKNKIQKIKQLNIFIHYDNDPEVVENLNGIGVLIGNVKRKEMKNKSESLTDSNEKIDMLKSNIWNNQTDMEKRFFGVKLEKRMDGEFSHQMVVGHAAVFEQLSEDLGGFQERIDKNAFDDVLDNDVRAFFNHDPNHLLARTSSGTLKLSVDEKGLKYEFSVPDTSSGRDLLVSMNRGDINQSSFAFTIDDDTWTQENGMDIRTINKVKRLYDVSAVSIPAYPGANDLAVAQRSFAINKEVKQRKQEEIDLIKRNLLDLNLKILKIKKNEK